MARHATAFYCNAVPYIFYIMRYERETWIIVSLMRAAGYYSKYQSVCVFFFSNFTAGCKWFAEAKAAFQFELTRDKLTVIRDLEKNYYFLFYPVEHIEDA